MFIGSSITEQIGLGTLVSDISNYILCLLFIDKYTKAKLSPDAYIQMAMQLAWYRTRGDFTATYETALTRFFLHGRTETIRTLSAESREFVLAMCKDEIPVSNSIHSTFYRLLIHDIRTSWP